MVFCKKVALTNFVKLTRKHLRYNLVFKEAAHLQSLTLSKKEIPRQMFSCEFCKISHNTFFKEPFGRLLLHKHSLCLLSYHDLSPFQKRCRTFFLAEYFFGLFFNLVKHLRWSFSCEKVNSSTPLGIFAKKLHCRCSTMF